MPPHTAREAAIRAAKRRQTNQQNPNKEMVAPEGWMDTVKNSLHKAHQYGRQALVTHGPAIGKMLFDTGMHGMAGEGAYNTFAVPYMDEYNASNRGNQFSSRRRSTRLQKQTPQQKATQRKKTKSTGTKKRSSRKRRQSRKLEQ